MPPVPAFLGLAFGLTTLLTGWLYWRAAPRPGLTGGMLLGWLLLQGWLGQRGFYAASAGLPPRLLLALGPPLLLAGALLGTRRGRTYLNKLSLSRLTWLHTVRLPVELVLLGLYRYGAVPQLLTLEGRNWDILSGLSAPLVYYLVFRRRVLGARALLAWNLLSLGLLLNVVGHAVLAVPSPLQHFGFEQPNVAVLYFPFVWLPAVVVPLVLLAHLAALRQLSSGTSHPAPGTAATPTSLVTGAPVV